MSEPTTDNPKLWHTWRKDGEDIDIFAVDQEYHNGPICERCYEGYCLHCDPDCYRYVCPDAQAAA